MGDAKHAPEPWHWLTFDRPMELSPATLGVELLDNDASRAFACVNALAGKHPEKLAAVLDEAGKLLDWLHSQSAPSASGMIRQNNLSRALAAFNGTGGGR